MKIRILKEPIVPGSQQASWMVEGSSWTLWQACCCLLQTFLCDTVSWWPPWSSHQNTAQAIKLSPEMPQEKWTTIPEVNCNSFSLGLTLYTLYWTFAKVNWTDSQGMSPGCSGSEGQVWKARFTSPTEQADEYFCYYLASPRQRQVLQEVSPAMICSHSEIHFSYILSMSLKWEQSRHLEFYEVESASSQVWWTL